MRTPEQVVSDALAVADGGLTQTALVRFLSAASVRLDGRRPTGASVRALVDALPGVAHDGRYYLLDPEPHFRRVWREGRLFEIYDALEPIEPFSLYSSYIACGPHVVRRKLRRALLSGDDGTLDIILRHAGAAALVDLHAWFFDPVDASMLDALTPRALHTVIRESIAQAAHDGVPLRDLQKYVTSRELNPALTLRLDLMAGRLDVARRALDRLPDDDESSCRGLLALLDGDPKASSKHYAAYLAAMRRSYGADFVPHDPIALYLPVAYMLHGTKSRTKQAQTLIERAWSRAWTAPNRMHAGWMHVATLADPTAPTAPTEHPLAYVLEALVAIWRGDAVDSERQQSAVASLRTVGLDLFADALEAGTEGRVARLRTARPAWKDALQALERALGSSTPGAKTKDADERLAWTLNLYGTEPDLEARLQKARKQGWSVGRKVAMSRLHGCSDGKLPWTDADRKLVSALRKRTYRSWSGYPEVDLSWDPVATWRALVGHPAVFASDGTPLRIVGRSPTLRVIELDGRIRLELEPRVGSKSVVVERVGDAYEVTMLERDQRAAAELIGGGLTFPATAAAAVRELVEGAGDRFRSEAPAARVRDGDPVVHAFLTPSGSAIAVELATLPCGVDGPRQIPGEGAGIVLGSESEGHVRVTRNLDLERAYLDQALSLPGMDDALPGEGVLLELDVALDFIARAREREIPVLWPEGGEIAVRRPTGALGLQIRSAREWFEARGTLELDDGERLSLVELARHLLESGRRFVKLDDGSYLELEAKLRRSLDALMRLGDPIGEAIRVHPLATSTLTSLLDLDGVSATRTARSRLEELTAERPPIEVPRGLKAELRPYQHDAVTWLGGLAELGAGAILADDMGLGKTITALAILLARRKEGPALVVAPTSVGGNWVRESARFTPDLSVHRLREIDAADLEAMGPADVVVCSYGLLIHRIDLLATRTWSTVVFDESQALKNPKTQRHQAALRIAAGFRLALTGTPIENHLGELHAQMSVVLPGLLGSARRFNERFAGPVEAGDRDARRSLKALVSPFLLRRTKQAVLDDLPPRTELEHAVELSTEELALYEAYRLEALESLEEGAGAMDVLGRLSRLRQLACSPALVVPEFRGESAKTKAFRRLARDLHAAGHRALVFSQFVKHLQLLRGVLDDEGLGYAYLDGSTPAAQRDARVDEFQTGDLPFFLISLKAGGTGLNLTAADYVLHMDPWWNPAVEDQASDRAHRIGQQRPVTVYRVVARGTVEEQIVALHRHKRDLADQILEGSETVSRLSAEDLVALLRPLA